MRLHMFIYRVRSNRSTGVTSEITPHIVAEKVSYHSPVKKVSYHSPVLQIYCLCVEKVVVTNIFALALREVEFVHSKELKLVKESSVNIFQC